jgi:hypothetical protein
VLDGIAVDSEGAANGSDIPGDDFVKLPRANLTGFSTTANRT